MDIMRRDKGALWDPAGELDRIRREIDDVIIPGSGRFFSGNGLGRGLYDREFSPALDIVEHDDEYVVSVDLPGVDQKDLEVTVANNIVTIKGEKRDIREQKEGKVFRKETWEGSFQRTISLPAGTDPTKVDASMTNGVLQVTLPKREEAKPRQISVSVQ
jgi:HSP20 family protein